MREKFLEVFRLQALHSATNTPEMYRRGLLIRDSIPNEMRRWLTGGELGQFESPIKVEGKDGVGRKTLIPWVRLFSPDYAPSALSGWYVVFLFRLDGKGVAMCLMHGSTKWDGRELKRRPANEARELVEWAEKIVGQDARALGMVPGLNLGSKGHLAKAYEATAAFSKTYDVEDLPDDDQFKRDTAAALQLLEPLYRTDPTLETSLSNEAEVASDEAREDNAGESQGMLGRLVHRLARFTPLKL